MKTENIGLASIFTGATELSVLPAEHGYLVQKFFENSRTTGDLQSKLAQNSSLLTSYPKHYLEELPRQFNNKIRRKRCVGCYKKQRDQGLTAKQAAIKTKQVSTECTVCKVPYCLTCFKKMH